MDDEVVCPCRLLNFFSHFNGLFMSLYYQFGILMEPNIKSFKFVKSPA